MTVILESILYKLNSPATNKTCDVTNQECNDVHGDNRWTHGRPGENGHENSGEGANDRNDGGRYGHREKALENAHGRKCRKYDQCRDHKCADKIHGEYDDDGDDNGNEQVE